MIKIIRTLRFPDILTLFGLAWIILAMYLVIAGFNKIGIGIMLFSMLFDFFDGWAARRYGGSGYGIFLDSGYDILAYLVFPAIYLMTSIQFQGFYIVFLIPMICAGILRLARFAKEGFADEKARYYTGMPVFYLSLIPILLYYGVPIYFIGFAIIIATALMVSEIKFLKPKHPVFALLILGLSVFFLL